MGVEVTPVSGRREMRQFIRFPYALYRDDPHYVPPLMAERKEFFSDQNPVFEFLRVRYFLARDEQGEIVGRTTAHVNERHNEFWDEQTGFFGFFGSVERPEVAAALMEKAESWLAEQGMETARGPLNFSTNQECGFLVEGHDSPPFVMMPYTKSYYPQMFEDLGYRKARDLLAYSYEYDGDIPDHLVRFGQRAAERSQVSVRSIDMDRFDEELAAAFEVYNRAWSENWGFVPMTKAQFRFTARNLKPIIDPELALLAELDGEPVGLFLALPDINRILKKMNGRLWPFGWLRFLLGRRRLHHVRVIILGVVDEYRRRGVDSLLSYRAFQKGDRKGYNRAEFSWILEENELMRRALDRLGATPYKTYRIYEKRL